MDPLPPCDPDGCHVAISPKQTFVNTAIVDYRVPKKLDEDGDIVTPDYTGPVKVAVVSNDTRLGKITIGEKDLGTLTNTHYGEGHGFGGRGLTKWYLPFTGLKPDHYYALVIYGTAQGYNRDNPFSRKCFLTAKGPAS